MHSPAKKLRIVIDMQGAQNGSRYRGIGRYTRALTDALAPLCTDRHELILAFNGAFGDGLEELVSHYAQLVDPANIHIWYPTGHTEYSDPENDSHRFASEAVREAALASLCPDMVVVSSMVEGAGDATVTSVGRFLRDLPIAAILYDLIPLIHKDAYLQDPRINKWYNEKTNHLIDCDILLSISESSKNEGIKYLGKDARDIFNISTAVSDDFAKSSGSKLNYLKNKFNITLPYLLYSGASDPRKNLPRLIEAFATLDDNIITQHQLVFAGGMPELDRNNLASIVARYSHLIGKVVFTDRVSDDEMIGLYRHSKAFVFPSYHEGFGLPVLEAMLLGTPVIGANRSSVPEIINFEEAMFDPFSTHDMRDKIHQVLTDPAFRNRLLTSARQEQKRFSWERSASLALRAIEERCAEFPERSRFSGLARAEQTALVAKYVKSVAQHRFLNDPDAIKATQGILRSIRKPNSLFVDISELYARDSGTGIQRVVKNVLNQIVNTNLDYVVFPVYVNGSDGYFVADDVLDRLGGLPSSGSKNYPMSVKPGDIFLGLDFHDVLIPNHRAFFKKMRKMGVSVYFVIYDLLPQMFKESFSEAVVNNHSQWLRTVAEMDGAIAISRTVADEYAGWLVKNHEYVSPNFRLGWFHLAGDISTDSRHRIRISETENSFIQSIKSFKTFLTVGTVEPRKQHNQILEAFETLWKEGFDVSLVIVGKKGWMVDDLVDRLEHHPERHHRLFWLQSAGDDMLNILYDETSCLIAASLGEGFGLPIAEAARMNLPVIARDIPVFREVAPAGTYFFEGLDGASLVRAVKAFLHTERRPIAVLDTKSEDPVQLPRNWAESSRQLLACVIDKQWYRYLDRSKLIHVTPADGRIGSLVGKKHDGRLISNGAAGQFLYGPWFDLEAGTYQFRFHLKTIRSSSAGGEITIYSEAGANQIAKRKIRNFEYVLNTGSCIIMRTTLDKACANVEMAITLEGGASIEFLGLDIERLDI